MLLLSLASIGKSSPQSRPVGLQSTESNRQSVSAKLNRNGRQKKRSGRRKKSVSMPKKKLVGRRLRPELPIRPGNHSISKRSVFRMVW